MVHAVRIKGGAASYANRLVKTHRLANEKEHGFAMYQKVWRAPCCTANGGCQHTTCKGTATLPFRHNSATPLLFRHFSFGHAFEIHVSGQGCMMSLGTIRFH